MYASFLLVPPWILSFTIPPLLLFLLTHRTYVIPCLRSPKKGGKGEKVVSLLPWPNFLPPPFDLAPSLPFFSDVAKMIERGGREPLLWKDVWEVAGFFAVLCVRTRPEVLVEQVWIKKKIIYVLFRIPQRYSRNCEGKKQNSLVFLVFAADLSVKQHVFII